MNDIFKIIFTVVGAIYVLFLPGLALSFVFFRQSAIDLIERIALSFALSIAVVPLLAFYLNLLGIKLTRFNVIMEVMLILALSGLTIYLRRDTSSDTPANHRAPLKAKAPVTTAPVSDQASKRSTQTRPKPKRLHL